MENTENLKAELIAEINRAADMKSLEEARVAILGKKGKITEMMKTLGALPQEEKIAMGKTLNILKGEIEKALAAQKAVLEAKELNDRLASETVNFAGSAGKSGAFAPDFADLRRGCRYFRADGLFGCRRAGYRRPIP